MNNSLLFDKVYGSLICAHIGDAMGGPVENMTYDDITKKYGWLEDFTGDGTDDTALLSILCKAIIDNMGRVTADELSQYLIQNRDKLYLFFIPVKNAIRKIENALSLPVYAGMGNMPSSSIAMGISPVGIINACDPLRAAADAFDISGLIHGQEASFCRDGACAIAAAVACAMSPVAAVDTVIEASTRYLHIVSSKAMTDKINKALDLADKCTDYFDFRTRYYANSLYMIPCDARETVPCALCMFYLAKGDPEKTITYSVNFGRDADTIAAMAGAIAGAYSGASRIKTEWIDKLKALSPGISTTANELIAVIKYMESENQSRSKLIRQLTEQEYI